MTLYILDTDHLSLYGRNHLALIEQLQANSVDLTTTAINVEEQLRGRLAQVAEAKVGISIANAYRWLSETVKLLTFLTLQNFCPIFRDFATVLNQSRA
jgi:tRNA(fMet)-specific endonuclease VapC